MIIRSEQNVSVLDNDGVSGKRIGDADGCELVRLELAPGREIPEHALPMPVTFYVLKGSGTVLLEGEQTVAHQGDLITVEAGANRGWRNTSAGELHILVIKHNAARGN